MMMEKDMHIKQKLYVNIVQEQQGVQPNPRQN